MTSSSSLMYPAGSQQIAFHLSIPASVNLSSPVFLANLTSDIAFNLANFYNLTTAQMLPYVKVVSVTLASSSTRRRLLQASSSNSANVDFVVSSAVSALGGYRQCGQRGRAVPGSCCERRAGCTIYWRHHPRPACHCGRRQQPVCQQQQHWIRRYTAQRLVLIQHTARHRPRSRLGSAGACDHRSAHLLLQDKRRQRSSRQWYVASAPASSFSLAMSGIAELGSSSGGSSSTSDHNCC